MKKTNTVLFWELVIQNISTISTILAAVIALILTQLGLISASTLPGVTIGLLALIAISQLVDGRRLLNSLSEKVGSLAEDNRRISKNVEIRRFEGADEAIAYLIWRTKSAKIAVDQASVDKQRARSTPLRKEYEQARSDLILSDIVKYRYIGLVGEKRQFRSIKRVLEQGATHRFFSAFVLKQSVEFPLMSFVVFDKEEVFTRAPYSTGEDPIYMSVRSRDIAELFGGYFEKIWNIAEKAENAESLSDIISNYQCKEVQKDITRP